MHKTIQFAVVLSLLLGGAQAQLYDVRINGRTYSQPEKPFLSLQVVGDLAVGTINGQAPNSQALPTPPATAIVYSTLQNYSADWLLCSSTSCAGGGTPGGAAGGTAAQTFGVYSPSVTGTNVSGGSHLLACTGSGANCLGYRTLACSGAACKPTNMLLDEWLYVPVADAPNVQAIERDPDAYDGQFEYFGSDQCDAGGTGNWRLWNMGANQWVEPAGTHYPCSIFQQPGIWHHHQLYVTFDYTAHTYTYQTLVVDGVPVFVNLGQTYPALALTATPHLNVEGQMDGKTGSTTNHLYTDQQKLTTW